MFGGPATELLARRRGGLGFGLGEFAVVDRRGIHLSDCGGDMRVGRIGDANQGEFYAVAIVAMECPVADHACQPGTMAPRAVLFDPGYPLCSRRAQALLFLRKTEAVTGYLSTH